MNKKHTKRALLSSVLALVLCVSMLIGSTFAWFTDEVTSGRNTIQAGNLDVELYYSLMKDGAWTDYEKVTESTDVFGYDNWEPGYTAVAKFKIVNEGSLAFKYQLTADVESETAGKNKDGNEFLLSDYLRYGLTEDLTALTDRDAAALVATEDFGSFVMGQSYLAKGGEVELGMVIYMPTTVGNVANHNGKDKPSIGFKLNLFATQYMLEEDSFGKDYDGAAPWTGMINTDWYFADPTATSYTINTAEELAGLAALVNGTAVAPTTTFAATAPATVQDTFKGKTIYLGADIDLNNVAWSPIGTNDDWFQANFDGQGHTIYNLKVDNAGWAGVIGHAGRGHAVTIKNLNVVGANITSNRMAGTIVGQLYGNVENCHVTNAIIKVTPNVSGNTYDNGDKVGGIVGWLGDNNNYHHLTDCSVKNVKVSAYRDVAGIVGYVAYSTTLKNNTATEVTANADQTVNYYGDKDANVGVIYGRTGGWITEEGNSFDELSTATFTFSKEKVIYKQDGLTGETRLYLVPADFTGTTVTVADGVDTIGGYAFAYNANIETIVLSNSVTTLKDRAFRDTSASTVVLNEGLTNISYQAFRNASNVTSVAIPSTVKTISKEAFQNSGVTSLVVPATVETIEYGAMRDMKMLTSVTIHGNQTIPVYAFRACTNLKTVMLTGDDVKFDGRGMIFTNQENGDGSAITVYVANDTVKDRLLAADTAAVDYGGYEIVVLGDKDEVADGLYKDEGTTTYYAASADGLAALNAMMVNKTAGKNVELNLLTDINMTGKVWTPVSSHADTAFTLKSINGNGHTISNLTVNGQAMFTRFAGTGDVAVKDLAFDNAKVNSNGQINTAILTVHTYQNVVLDNVDVKNTSITGGYKVAPLIATVYNEGSSTITATLKNCDVENVTVTATTYDFCTAGMVAFVYAGDNDKIEFENCTVTNVTLRAPDDVYKAHAYVYTTGSGSLYNEADGVTVTNVTFEKL